MTGKSTRVAGMLRTSATAVRSAVQLGSSRPSTPCVRPSSRPSVRPSRHASDASLSFDSFCGCSSASSLFAAASACACATSPPLFVRGATPPQFHRFHPRHAAQSSSDQFVGPRWSAAALSSVRLCSHDRVSTEDHQSATADCCCQLLFLVRISPWRLR